MNKKLIIQVLPWVGGVVLVWLLMKQSDKLSDIGNQRQEELDSLTP
jgi:hypothetical protein